MTLKHRWVHFRIRDVYYPDANQVLNELHSEDVLQGRVLEVSDNGRTTEAFAVVEVEGLAQPVIVPASRVIGAL